MVYHLFNKYRIFYKKDSDIELAKNYIQQRLDNEESVIFVETAFDNYHAQKLYEKIGFKAIEPESSFMIYKYEI